LHAQFRRFDDLDDVERQDHVVGNTELFAEGLLVLQILKSGVVVGGVGGDGSHNRGSENKRYNTQEHKETTVSEMTRNTLHGRGKKGELFLRQF
jgi:hypothetical protein